MPLSVPQHLQVRSHGLRAEKGCLPISRSAPPHQEESAEMPGRLCQEVLKTVPTKIHQCTLGLLPLVMWVSDGPWQQVVSTILRMCWSCSAVRSLSANESRTPIVASATVLLICRWPVFSLWLCPSEHPFGGKKTQIINVTTHNN